ncbi:MAG: protein phosphatase 2C domain-containing protein [Thalassobaculaceae bacterium]|nr:protein phosphatase 2C domain-containing protein [Thalassobaculaceae bacterium]
MTVWHQLSWRSAGQSRKGPRRAVNEDAFLDASERGLWVVADGMGGHAAGDLASDEICRELGALELNPTINECIARIEACLRRVNTSLRNEARARGPEVLIGSTFAAVLIRGRHAVCLWSGDSRAYLSRDDALFQLTRDHKLVEDMVCAGEIGAADVAHHPHRHIITRAIGAEASVHIDLNHVTLTTGDRLLLCTDGLSDCLDPATIAGTMRDDPADAVACLLDAGDAQGRKDDATAVAITITGESAIDDRSTAP